MTHGHQRAGLPGWVWMVGIAVSCAVIAILWVALKAGPSTAISYTDGLSPVQPSRAQLQVMAIAYQDQFGASLEYGVPHPPAIGCAVYSMAIRSEPGGEVDSYANVFCQSCPEVVYGGITPAVFVLRGLSVVSVKTVMAITQATAYPQIQRLFPHQLWAAANDQRVSDLNGLITTATRNAGC